MDDTITTNVKFIDNDTAEVVSKYIDDICSDPSFLCKNKTLCGTNSTLYSSVKNIDKVCKNIDVANQCEDDIQDCIVVVKNTFDETQKSVSTSFVNIIIPIPNAIDSNGNNKFLRLPPLSGSKKKNSNEICKICECMDRFATSPGAGGNNNDTSPGQNQCIYKDSFEYFYYPLYIENIKNKLKDAPPTKLGKYIIDNKNIIYANSQEDLEIKKLYDILTENGISKFNSIYFLTNILYKNDEHMAKGLKLYLLNKNENLIKSYKNEKKYNKKI